MDFFKDFVRPSNVTFDNIFKKVGTGGQQQKQEVF